MKVDKMTVHDMQVGLALPFPKENIQWRLQRSGLKRDGSPWGMAMAYLDSRAIMNRLDQIVGMNNWNVELSFTDKGCVAKLGLKIDHEWVYKEDVAEFPDTEPFKGAASGALKRAAVHWGIGRYLYRLSADFAEFVPPNVKGARRASVRKNKESPWQTFYWLAPQLPQWALPVEKKDKDKDKK